MDFVCCSGRGRWCVFEDVFLSASALSILEREGGVNSMLSAFCGVAFLMKVWTSSACLREEEREGFLSGP